MFTAKQVGRNKVQSYAPGMNKSSQDMVRLESDLHIALAQQQFELHFQPKVDIKTGMVSSAEALVRWRHPERGMISPADFIPLAEECGLIGGIGNWVGREACRQGRAWQDEGFPPLRIAVNLSASQFRASNLVELIRAALTHASFDAHSLEV
jgi:EAL domain-containing protein (putative c-di-GMP-specific phosphodiesterase class I)